MTYRRRLARCLLPALAAPLVMAGVLTGAGPAAAAACQSWTGVLPPGPGTSYNELDSVAVLSPCNVWAVGFDFSGAAGDQTLIEHWNGSSWTVVPSPDPSSSGNNILHGVHAISASSIWAVGVYSHGAGSATLILHWNGTRWRRTPSPSPGPPSFLTSVAATSAGNAWAVGTYSGSRANQTLILRWNGHRWARATSPSPGGSARISVLWGVAATSARNAWAVGDYDSGSADNSLVLHWNGTRWRRTPSPSPGSGNALLGVAATAGNAWAVGYSGGTGGAVQPLAWHCC